MIGPAPTPAPGRRLRLLVVAPDVPRPDEAGGDRRLFEILRLLAARHAVDLCPFAIRDAATLGARHVEAARAIGVDVLAPGWLLGLESALIRRVYDAVVFEFWTTASAGIDYVRRVQPWARAVVDTVDVHFVREAEGLAVGASDAASVAANKRLELAIYRSADAVVCVSDDDARALDAEGGVAPVHVVPLVVPARPRPDRDGDRPRELLFLGGFRHAPNLDGLLWFAREAWPSIRSAVPEARLTVVGCHPTAEVAALGRLDGVEVVGRVPETGPYFDRAALMVAPLRFGAGMKSKVVEAMASGLPVVTTRVGAQGLGASSGEHLVIADDPDAFARSVARLLADPVEAERIGRAGRRLVAGLCAPESASSRLEAMLAEVVGRGGPGSPPIRWRLGAARRRARRACARIARSLATPRTPSPG